MSAALARSADLVVRIDRGSDGPFRVVAVEDSAGAPIFRHENGKLVRGTGTPAFAATPCRPRRRLGDCALAQRCSRNREPTGIKGCGCDWPPHTDRRRKPVTTHSYIWY